MEYNTVYMLERKGKRIFIYLRDGENMHPDNIVDVYVEEKPGVEGNKGEECEKFV